MARASSVVALCVLALSLGCRRGPTSEDLVKKLADPDPQVRAAAALSLRNMAAADAAAVGDHGEAFWKTKLAYIRPGTSDDDVASALGTPGKISNESGGPWSQTFKLDDFWSVRGSFSLDKSASPETYRLSAWDPPVCWARRVEVSAAPGPAFTGKWSTYYINGAVASEAEYDATGRVVRETNYFDNGQLMGPYVGGNEDGFVVTYFRDGKKATEGRYAKGKRTGRWVEYHASGKPYVEATYVDGEIDGSAFYFREDGTKSRMDYRLGKETGQAAWDGSGKLEYARGSAADAGGPDAAK
ncbi:MAG: hypothetical protein JWM74_1892 [Myxococcaceae bacterium]|nr:hypothetical protein [Myxococcaceae bacterium]